MRIRFKGGAESFECTEPVEQMQFKAGLPAGWFITFIVYADIDSSKFDELITAEGISELSFICKKEDAKELKVTGYTTINLCRIRHNENKTAIEIQLTKNEIESDKN